MDFTTMVSNFKRRVLDEGKEELEELSEPARREVRRYIDHGTPERHTPRYSFNHIFGDQTTMRIAIPIKTTVKRQGTELFKRIVEQGWVPKFTTEKKRQKLQRRVGDLPDDWRPNDDDPRPVEDYEVDVDIPVLSMEKEEVFVIPKGPKKGERRVRSTASSLGKLVNKIGTPEDKQWWAKNHNNLRETENVRDYFMRPWLDDFEETGGPRPSIIITRHPMDVARMADFSMIHSCHTEGAAYGHCSIEESKGHGLIAFLVRGEDVEEHDLLNRLDEDEIFGDRDINFPGPEPVSRARLIKMFNPDTGEEFGLPETLTYGVKVPDFLPTVVKWARDVQKEQWADKDGNIKEDFLDPDKWIRIGGSYSDTEYYGGKIGDLIPHMFVDSEQEVLASEWEGVDYEHKDYFGESESDEKAEEEAQEALNEIQTSADNRTEHGGFGFLLSETGDGGFQPEGDYYVVFKFPMDKEWAENPDRSPVLTYGDIGYSYSHARRFKTMLNEALRTVTYVYSIDPEWDFKDTGTEIVIDYNIKAPTENFGLAAIEEIDSWVDEVVNEVEGQHRSIWAALRFALVEGDYLPAGPYEKAVEEFDEIVGSGQFENLSVLYDESDPADGIDIAYQEKWVTHYAGTGPRKGHKIIASFPRVDQHGRSVAEHFEELIPQTKISLRQAFKQLIHNAEKEAKKQMELPLGARYKAPEASITWKGIPTAFKTGMLLLPASTTQPLTAYSKPLSPEKEAEWRAKDPLEVGLRFDLKINMEITEEEYEKIRIFLDYLDKNIEMFEKAAATVAERIYKKASAYAREDVEADRILHDPASQKRATRALDRLRGRVGEPEPAGAPARGDLGGIPTRRSGAAEEDDEERRRQIAADANARTAARALALADPDADVFEGKIREVIRKVIRKHVLKEQTGFETRLFQISLRLQIDKGAGGGIEQKLNRIRSIQGVTVVGHEEGENIGGKSVIVARIKFHPASDSLRPYSYINQILVPDINSSKSVPGVRVMEIIRGTLKRLDK